MKVEIYDSGAEALRNFDVVIFDFDGVIIDSNIVKEKTFQRVFHNLNAEQNAYVSAYHHDNLGVPRSEKIAHLYRYFYEKEIAAQALNQLCLRFSEVSLRELSSRQYLISDTISFVREIHSQKRLYVASAASEDDVIYLCKKHNINQFFEATFGSPQSKIALVENICGKNLGDKICLVGDSIHDFLAADANGVDFYAYNNASLIGVYPYIRAFAK